MENKPYKLASGKITMEQLTRIYEQGVMKAGDTDYDFYIWATDYLLGLLNERNA